MVLIPQTPRSRKPSWLSSWPCAPLWVAMILLTVPSSCCVKWIIRNGPAYVKVPADYIAPGTRTCGRRHPLRQGRRLSNDQLLRLRVVRVRRSKLYMARSSTRPSLCFAGVMGHRMTRRRWRRDCEIWRMTPRRRFWFANDLFSGGHILRGLAGTPISSATQNLPVGRRGCWTNVASRNTLCCSRIRVCWLKKEDPRLGRTRGSSSVLQLVSATFRRNPCRNSTCPLHCLKYETEATRLPAATPSRPRKALHITCFLSSAQEKQSKFVWF